MFRVTDAGTAFAVARELNVQSSGLSWTRWPWMLEYLGQSIEHYRAIAM